MTQDELLELQRLEVNVSRLGDIVTRQGGRIVELEQELRLRQEELSRLKEDLEKASQQSSTTALSLALRRGATGEELQKAKGILDEIIKEVEHCIRQLAAE